MNVRQIAKMAGVGYGTVSVLIGQMSIPIKGISYDSGGNPRYDYHRHDAMKVVVRLKAILKKQKAEAKRFMDSLK